MVQNTLSCEPLVEYMQNNECSQDAIEFLNILWRTIQYLDDKYDGDDVKTSTLEFMQDIFFSLHTNGFYVKNFHALNTAIFTMIAKWEAANFTEQAHGGNHLSFVWRAGYYDLAVLVYYLCKGYNNAIHAAYEILSMYGESYEAYKQEFKACQTPYQQ